MLRLDAGNLRGDLCQLMLARLGKLADGGEKGGVEDPLQHLLGGDKGLQVGEGLRPLREAEGVGQRIAACAGKRIWWSCSSTSAAWIWPSCVGVRPRARRLLDAVGVEGDGELLGGARNREDRLRPSPGAPPSPVAAKGPLL